MPCSRRGCRYPSYCEDGVFGCASEGAEFLTCGFSPRGVFPIGMWPLVFPSGHGFPLERKSFYRWRWKEGRESGATTIVSKSVPLRSEGRAVV